MGQEAVSLPSWQTMKKDFVAPAAAQAEQPRRKAVLSKGVELLPVNLKSKRNVV